MHLKVQLWLHKVQYRRHRPEWRSGNRKYLRANGRHQSRLATVTSLQLAAPSFSPSSHSSLSVMIKMQQSTCQEDRVSTGCVRVFLALVTAHGFESIHISKRNPGVGFCFALQILTASTNSYWYTVWIFFRFLDARLQRTTQANVAALNALRHFVRINGLHDVKGGSLCGYPALRWAEDGDFYAFEKAKKSQDGCLMCGNSNIYSCETVNHSSLFYHPVHSQVALPLVLGAVMLQDVRVFLPELLSYNVAVVLLHPPPAAGHRHLLLLLVGKLCPFCDSFLLLRLKNRGHD